MLSYLAVKMADAAKTRHRSVRSTSSHVPGKLSGPSESDRHSVSAVSTEAYLPVSTVNFLGQNSPGTTRAAHREIPHTFSSLREHMQAMESEAHVHAGKRGLALDATQSTERPASASPARSQRPGAPPPPSSAPRLSAYTCNTSETWSYPQPFLAGQTEPLRHPRSQVSAGFSSGQAPQFQPRSFPNAWPYYPHDPRQYGYGHSDFSGMLPINFPRFGASPWENYPPLAGEHAPRLPARSSVDRYDRYDRSAASSAGAFRRDSRIRSRSRTQSGASQRSQARSPRERSRSPPPDRRRSRSFSPSEFSVSSHFSTDDDSLSVSQRADLSFTEVGKLLHFPPPSPVEAPRPSYRRDIGSPQSVQPTFPIDRLCTDIMDEALQQVQDKQMTPPLRRTVSRLFNTNQSDSSKYFSTPSLSLRLKISSGVTTLILALLADNFWM